MSRPCGWAAAGLVLAATAGCFDLGSPPTTRVVGRLSVGPGIVFMEKGIVHNGTFARSGLIDANGRFSIELPSGGPWGIHTYVDGYIYLPMQLQIVENQANRVRQEMVDWTYLCDSSMVCDWVPQTTTSDIITPARDPDPSDNPVIQNPMVEERGGGYYRVTVDVSDPNDDLGPQVLVAPGGTGDGYQLNPPGPVVDNRYPQGTYTLTPYVAHIDRTTPWFFMVADNGCSNTPVVRVLQR